MSKKIYIETYGCQMNVGDSEVIFSILGKEGYERTESMDDADVILANTCSVRDNAEQRIWGRIEVFHKQKEKRSGVVVGIVGCMAERLKDKLLDTHKVACRRSGLLQDASDAAPGHRAGQAADQRDALTRRDLRRHRAGQDRQERGLSVHLDHEGMQQCLLVLRGSLHQGRGKKPRSSNHCG